jgi:mono/diheme cytochrome c family protein
MRRRGVLALALVLASLGGCGDDGTLAATRAPLADHPGAEAYAAHCASCHGTDLRGTEDGPSHLSWVYEPNHHPDRAFEMAIRLGVRAHHWSFGDMLPVEDIADDEIPLVISYVRAVQDREGFEPYPPR